MQAERNPPSVELSSHLELFQQNITKLQRLVDFVEHVSDGPDQVREQLNVTIAISNQLCGLLVAVNGSTDPRHQKLNRDYRQVHRHFLEIKNRATSTLEQQNARTPRNHESASSHRESNFRVLRDPVTNDNDLRLQLRMKEDAINEAIMREREDEIREIHKSVLQVNEVFKDLAQIVDDQQQEIDAVETMIERSHQHARSGLQHVQKASDNQGGCVVS